MAKAHFFNFVGGDALSRMGATWFVSYAYYCEVDPQHMAWKNVKTYPMRRNIYFTTKEHHIFWLTQVLDMEDKRLNTNNLKLMAGETKHMAREILKKKNEL